MTEFKKAKIKGLVEEMLRASCEAMHEKIDKILDSGAIDVSAWSETDKPMILPKCIVMALIEHQQTQYDGRGTDYQKQIKKEVRNIRYFI